MSTAILDVYLQDNKVGQLTLDNERQFHFQYDQNWLQNVNAIPISLSLPLRADSFDEGKAHPFFSNLLPESEVRRVLARKLGISFNNDFALLKAIGGECAGALSLFPHGTTLVLSGEYRPLNKQEVRDIMLELPRKPFLIGEDGLRLSLAGAQYKLPLYIKNDEIYLPLGHYPSSHILKPPIPHYSATVINETFCMLLARKLGLPVATPTIYRELITLYCSERYDRQQDQDGNLIRLHQEDFCQALGVAPEQKYENEGGPSLQQCFNLLKKYSIQPAVDQATLLRWVIFNYLIGNADGHAKNLALLLLATGPQLAPFYDLFCTAVYPELTPKLAMKIGGENRPAWIQWRHWQRFAAENNISVTAIRPFLTTMATEITTHAKKLAHEMAPQVKEDSILLEKIIKLITKQAHKTLAFLKHL